MQRDGDACQKGGELHISGGEQNADGNMRYSYEARGECLRRNIRHEHTGGWEEGGGPNAWQSSRM